ncbi:hypothetical protein SAMD00019534_053800, partial [Acytostelium subglobosum LB1]|uniref:hypothetical protein n=1 Tax=Acytostelium subglobosum LB1 TaxID=1410327 RepID=UPI0006447FAC
MITNYTYVNKIIPRWGPNYLPWDVHVQNAMDPHDVCIYPDIPRTYHSPKLLRDFQSIYDGEDEVDIWSYYQFNINDMMLDIWNGLDLSYLLKVNYDTYIDNQLKSSIVVQSLDVIPFLDKGSISTSYALPIDDVTSDTDQSWDKYLHKLGLTGRGNGGAVRCIYQGVITSSYIGSVVYYIGKYSRHYKSLNNNHMVTIDDVANGLDFDPSITSIKSLGILNKLMRDSTLKSIVAGPGHSCKEACSTQSKQCLESDQLLLLDDMSTLYRFETVCDKVIVAKDDQINGWPIRYSNYTCSIPLRPSRLSCLHHPPTLEFSEVTSHFLCICRDNNNN